MADDLLEKEMQSLVNRCFSWEYVKLAGILKIYLEK